MILRLALGLLLLVGLVAPAQAQSREEIERTMMRATRFMVEHQAVNGGYVWSSLPDGSRRWGEIEARPSMVWVQPPGTGTMGHLFLDAYHATRDEYYYRAAEEVAGALIWGQLPSGGWNYFIDFAGEASTRQWYATVGANAWRMEEFQHYGGNGTFDDAGTSEAMQFLLRMYLEKRDPKYRPALERAVGFVLDSQYPIGGWPQRYPHSNSFPEYADYITFNDDVAAENIRFLTMAYQALGGSERVRDAINRGMNVFLVTQQGAPQPGWALQYTLDLQPAGARTYEPRALVTHTTAANVRALMEFYRATGETKFLARIPEALDWLDTVRLPAGQEHGNRAFPTFIEIGTNRPLYVHRRGSNVVNGGYYVDYSPEATIGHYSAWRAIDVPALRRDYEALRRTPPEQLRATSPLYVPTPLPRYFASQVDAGSDLNAGSGGNDPRTLIHGLNADGYWPTPLRATSNPYIGPGPATPPPGDFRTTRVGDASDSSPFETDHPVTGISTATYIANMAKLIQALPQHR